MTFTAPLNTLAEAPEVTCTISNPAQLATLRLDKILVNDDGGAATVTQFAMTATGQTGTIAEQTSLSGVVDTIPTQGTSNSATVNAGTYSLSETLDSGYTASDWSCVLTADPTQTISVVVGAAGSGTADVTVDRGADITCTITNDDNNVDLSVTKSDGGITASPGQTFPYTITVRNIGTHDVAVDDPVTLTDVLPAQLSFVSGPSECVAAGQTITCAVDPTLLNVGGSGAQIVLQVAFRAGTPSGTYTNLAYVDSREDPAPPNPSCVPATAGGPRRQMAAAVDPANNVACEDTPLVSTYGLTAVKAGFEVAADGSRTPTDGTVEFGSMVAYDIAVSATGDAPQTNVTLTDTIPVGTTYVDGSAHCVAPATCTVTYDPVTRMVTAVLGSMAPGASIVVTFTVTVDAAPTLAPGMSYTWTGRNVAGVHSTEIPSNVPSNEVVVKASTSELPKTGTEIMSIAGGGILVLLAGLGLILVARRRPGRR